MINYQKYKRIVIAGSGGSGKSWLATKLAEQSGYPLTHLDCEFWKPNWTATPIEEFAEKQRELVAGEEWIIEGNYASTMDIRFERADLVIFLDINRWLCLWRVIRRNTRKRADLPEYLEEKFDKKFYDFCKYIYHFPKDDRYKVFAMRDKFPDKNFILLKSRREVNNFIIKETRENNSNK